MSNKKNDYEVGYRKPPKRSQFAKGQSGNRKGRPKGTKNLKTDLAEELSELIHIKVSGRKVKVSKQRAMLKGLLVKAMKGDPTAAKVMLGLIERLLNLDDESQGQKQISKGDQEILDLYIKSTLSISNKENGHV